MPRRKKDVEQTVVGDEEAGNYVQVPEWAGEQPVTDTITNVPAEGEIVHATPIGANIPANIADLVPEEITEQADPERVVEELRGNRVRDLPAETTEPATMDVGGADAANAISKMQEQIRSLEGDLGRVRQGKAAAGTEPTPAESSRGGYPWQFFFRPMRKGDPMSGWVVCAPGGAGHNGQRSVGAYGKYLSKGFMPINDFGPCPIPSTARFPGRIFRSIFEGGGANIFPPSQVVAYRWHISPPFPGIKFPQLDDTSVKDKVRLFTCDSCSMELWFIEDAPGSDETVNQIVRHLQGTLDRGGHGYRLAEAREALNEQGIAYTRRSKQQEYAQATA